ncbi:gliding motility-associated C-terminal domain-containing protein [Fluviicola sp.]|uniref:T9SS type B sorting domain-containing protein n=1 Tax=Fluviicola sp. TaxID=1917219 RepID=UPI0031DA52EF
MIKPAFYITILLFVLLNHSQAQPNLIYNGDFEEYSSCPQYESSPFQNPKEIEKCIGWKAPTYGTSDYFNTCATNPTISVPANALGIQNPYSGNGYLGGSFTNYGGGAGNDGYSGIMWWEYIQGQLISQLEENKIYKLSMEVSLAEYSDLMINEIGAYFSDFPISSPNTAALTVNPQCVFYNSNHFGDTLNWQYVETIFIASGHERYVTIGNFRNDTSTDTLRRYDISPTYVNPYVTYFYIDNVVLTSVNIDIPNIFTPNNDGINDLWSLPFSDASKKVSILNRWGNLIYENDLENFAWDGKTQKGEECLDGIYFYRINNTNIAGFIQLVR